MILSLKQLRLLITISVAVSATSTNWVMADTSPIKSSPPTLLSAFFGLDNAMPFAINILCFGAAGDDGMPVVLSHRISSDSLRPEQFQITTRSGQFKTPECATLRPAGDPGERRTVLLIGEFGNADTDPPEVVTIVEDLLSDTAAPLNFNGQSIEVTPLSEGPSMVLAESVDRDEWAVDRRGTQCPSEGVRQIIRVTWNGGVRLANREEPGDAEKDLYSIKMEREQGESYITHPIAIAELGDNDNHHFLCLDTDDQASAVSFPSGHFIDPNRDLNPDTRVMLQPR
jgi:hypothetical protein